MTDNLNFDSIICEYCDKSLAGQRYVLKEEKPLCIVCYEQNIANICEDCKEPIGVNTRDLSYKDKHWHDTCFVCKLCKTSLIDTPFGSKSEQVYCVDCYDTNFAAKCDGCKNPFRAGKLILDSVFLSLMLKYLTNN